MGCFPELEKVQSSHTPLSFTFAEEEKLISVFLTLGSNIKMDTAPFSQAFPAGEFSEIRYP